MSELDYEIQELYIEGYSARTIAIMLNCPIDLVLGCIEEMGVSDQEDASPYATINS
jgi:hypothetical protein